MNIVLFNRDEFFVIELNNVMFFKAEDHYTNVYYDKEFKQLLPFGLSQVESAITEEGKGHNFIRAGRSHLINAEKVLHVSATKETMTLMGDNGKVATIHIPKNIIKELTQAFKDERSRQKEAGSADN